MSVIYLNKIEVKGGNALDIFKDYMADWANIDFNLITPLSDPLSRPESLDKWGSRDNAYCTTIGNDFILFCTDNDTPRKIFLEISKRHPDIYFHISYSGERIYSGIISVKDGIMTEIEAPPESKRTLEEKRAWNRFYYNLEKENDKDLTPNDCGLDENFDLID